MPCDFRRSATVVVQINQGYVDIFCNWLRSFRALGLTNTVVAMAYGDAATAQAASALGHDHVISVEGFRTKQATFTFGSHQFNQITLNKVSLMLGVLHALRRPVVFTDIDTVWLRDPLELLQGVHRGLALVPEGTYVSNGTVSYVCSCFIAACPDGPTRKLLHAWRAATRTNLSDAKGRRGLAGGFEQEQAVLSRLLGERRLLDGRESELTLLPRRAFPAGGNGRTAKRGCMPAQGPCAVKVGDGSQQVAWAAWRREQLTTDVRWVHANYVWAKAWKVKWLKSLGLWQPECPSDLVQARQPGWLQPVERARIAAMRSQWKAWQPTV